MKSKTIQRCATMNRLQLYTSNLSATRSNTEGRTRTFSDSSNQRNFRLQAEVTIPVVVHVVLPNPYLVTDADVQAQIDRLNLDFSGLNPDSTNATGFYNIRGHSRIRFCLARRTPDGKLTTGIERRSSNVGSNVDEMQDPIKYTARGGLDAWNTADYLNLWVGRDMTDQGILGYADNIGPGTGTSDGVFLNVEGFGVSSCYTKAPYNRGRTATHEIGHFFGLYHIWADDNGGCTGDDFGQLPASSSTNLPQGLFNPSGQGNGALDVGDTPNQGDASGSCLTGVQMDGCSSVATGKMYQNHMDYTYDACLTLFTAQQVARMEWVLDNARSGLKSSLGCQPPSNAPLLDIAPLASVSPGGFEFAGCQVVNYPSFLACPGTVTPKFRVVNNGLNTITTLTVGYSYDNGPAVTRTISVTVPHGGFYVASFPAIPVGIGNHTFRFFTTAPNGSTDQVTTNDSYTQTLTVMSPIPAPVTEGFEGTLQNWSIDNPDFDFTWQRTTPGSNSSAGKLSIDNFNNDGVGHRDDLRSTAITVDPSATYFLTFELAHKNYPDPEFHDSLAVLLSTDCGQTFNRIYYKGGAALATAGSSEEEYVNPASGDWRTETITLSSNQMASGQIVVLFRNISSFGNWVHLDNINLVKVGARDLRVSAINAPNTALCVGEVRPSVTVENVGTEAVTAFSIGYRIDNEAVRQQVFTQAIQPGASATVSLPAGTTSYGQHNLTVFSFNPVTTSGSGDTRLSNDTLRKSFTVTQPVFTPLVENFETSFPPAGWRIGNSNNNTTWVRKSPGRNSNFTAFFDNYNNNLSGEVDDLQTPFMDVAGADSVVITFDVAHKNHTGNSGSSNDKLSVLTTADCANTFQTIYSKSGATLATAGSTAGEYLTPVTGDWRTERVVLNATAIASGNLGVVFRNTNDFGNNIFIDNINVTAVYKRDIQLVSVQQPGRLLCSPSVIPSVTVRNLGTDTVKSFTLVYSVNNGAAVALPVTGVSIARGADATVSLPQVSGLAAGLYNFRVNATGLITARGTGDSNVSNDTLRTTFAVPGTVTAPLTESFTNVAFPPANWSVMNNDGAATWQRYNIGNGTTGSAMMNTFHYTNFNEADDLVSPVLRFDAADSAKLSFDLSAALFSQPGANVPLDTLEVLVSKDCGNSFTTVYKKWGADLQTVSGPRGTEFFPATSMDWRKEMVDLSSFIGQTPVVVFFRSTNNNENNIFLDNIRFTTQVLPTKLKETGVLLFPAPFSSSFTVWHYQMPSALQSIRVVNMAGQTVWLKQFTGNADKLEMVNMAAKPGGMYLVEISYSNGRKTITQKVLKQ
ncbi:MAG: choice-of-anchor J domain-containing protein [Bacteroidota bacterium]|nr:choice-of-anchor J domain-containing protein [Bacteroidota bacterium]